MIIGMLDDEALPWIIENGISFYVFEFDRLDASIREAKRLGIKARIHVEVETGFHRTGFEWEEREQLSRLIQENPEHLELVGLCTHYAGAESINNYVRIQNQIQKYHEFKNWLMQRGLIFQLCHTACSAASLTYPETIMDMVRIGILQYGFWPSQETYMSKFRQLDPNKKNPLKRLIVWKSRVMSIKGVAMGSFVGYGNSYMAHRDMLIAQVPISYSKGYSRILSNCGTLLIPGKFMSVVGTVTMTTIAIDITALKATKKGDEVITIGQ